MSNDFIFPNEDEVCKKGKRKIFVCRVVGLVQLMMIQSGIKAIFHASSGAQRDSVRPPGFLEATLEPI